MSNNAISSSLPMAAVAQPKASTSGSSSSNSSTSSTDSIGSTFLNLLVSELQNQDPTAPMDSTAMVGQMISLNQLDQLTSINQTLSTNLKPTSSTSGSATGQNASSAAKQMLAASNSNPASSASDAAYKAMQMLGSGAVPNAIPNPYLGGAANLPADTSSPLSLSSLASSLAR